MRESSVTDDRVQTPSLEQILINDSSLKVKIEKIEPYVILETENSAMSVVNSKNTEFIAQQISDEKSQKPPGKRGKPAFNFGFNLAGNEDASQTIVKDTNSDQLETQIKGIKTEESQEALTFEPKKQKQQFSFNFK